MVDEFILKPRKQYAKSYIYLYNQEGEFIGKYLGKEIGLDEKQKEIEDLKKAIWYIKDRIKILEE